MASNSGVSRRCGYVSSVGYKIQFVNLDDVDIVREVKNFKERMRFEGNPTGESDCSVLSKGIESDVSGSEEVDERDLSRGGDEEFLEQLIADYLGGSDAVDVYSMERALKVYARMKEPNESTTSPQIMHLIIRLSLTDLV